MLDVFFSAASGPIWGVGGILLTVLSQIVVARIQNRREGVRDHLSAVQNAQQQLTDALFQQIKQLSDELVKVKEELARCSEQHRAADRRVDELEIALNSMRGLPAE